VPRDAECRWNAGRSNLGPELTRAGSKVKTEWLADWLRDPKTYDPDTRMPHYRLDAKEVGF